MNKRRFLIELPSRLLLAILAVALFSATYLQMGLSDLPEIALYAPAMLLREPVLVAPLAVADVALVVMVLIAKVSQLRSIFRCYVYAGIGYAIGIYLIGKGYELALPAPFYGPLIGWAIAVLHNHFGPAIWSYMVNRTRTSTTRPRCL